MPIFRANNKVVYYAHVPKCAGTSVEEAIVSLGYDLQFRDIHWWGRGSQWWNRSSPQHIPSVALNALFGDNFFDNSFGVVRHPLDRYLSAFNYNRLRGHIPWYQTAEGFARKLLKSYDFLSGYADNHFIPASKIIPENATTFKLEEQGLEQARDWLAENVDPRLGELEFKRENACRYNSVRSIPRSFVQVRKMFVELATRPRSLQVPVGGTAELESLVYQLYRLDYTRFGYARRFEAAEPSALKNKAAEHRACYSPE